MTCWFCGRSDGEIERYAMVETPRKHAFDAHGTCLARNGVSGELVPLVIEPDAGDV